MYYTIYKVTNKINGKFYIGSHKTKNLDDRYMGSGKYLKYAQDKYGLEKFERETLFVFDNPGDMYAKEAEIVNENFIAEENTYNIKVGGFGGWDYINANPSKYLTEKRLNSLMTNQERLERWRQKYETDAEFRKRCHENLKKAKQIRREIYPEGTFKGKTHSNETRQKMSDTAKERLKDQTKNSQFGTKWIYCLELKQSKKINKDDLIPEGWELGRKIKF